MLECDHRECDHRLLYNMLEDKFQKAHLVTQI